MVSALPSEEMKTPLPGTVVKVVASAGDSVAEGDVTRLDYVTVYDLFTIHIKDGQTDNALYISADEF